MPQGDPSQGNARPLPGWYTDPSGHGMRWWNGSAWGQQAPDVHPQRSTHSLYSQPPQEKSSAVALLITILWPGGGHLYLGLTRKGLPYVVANAIGFVLGVLTLIFLPVAVVIWIVTLCMTVGSITDDTNFVNDALRRGQKIVD
ncbi:DUF2510 domain-containing protein [Mycobacterium sp. GA-1199]|uniref:DUF2510 domain-containing protein n=1 Tax=Mycobacterium sp. GA-1199 TaxID=1772287 RepID=UPI0009EB9665